MNFRYSKKQGVLFEPLWSRVILSSLLLSIFFVVCNNSFAINLGDLKLYSYLNEPLNAEIILSNVDEIDTNNILVDLASPKDFMRSGIPRCNGSLSKTPRLAISDLIWPK